MLVEGLSWAERLGAVVERADEGGAVQGPGPARARAARGAVRRGRRAARDDADQGRVVPGLAADEHRRHLPRRGRHRGERGGVRPSGVRARGRVRRVPAGARGRARPSAAPMPSSTPRSGAYADRGDRRLGPRPARLARSPACWCSPTGTSTASSLWNAGGATGAELLWRTKADHVLPVDERLADGSFLSTRLPVCAADRRHDRRRRAGRRLRHRRPRPARGRPRYRLLTTILDSERPHPRPSWPRSTRAVGVRDRPGRAEDPPARPAAWCCAPRCPTASPRRSTATCASTTPSAG